MTPKPEDVLVRGTPILGLCRFLEKELSADVRDGINRRLPESFAERAEIHVAEFPGDPAVCGRITGWFRYIGALSGARNLRSRHDRCTSKGHAECVWEFEWE